MIQLLDAATGYGRNIPAMNPIELENNAASLVFFALALVVLPVCFIISYRRIRQPYAGAQAFLVFTFFGNVGGVCLMFALSPSPCAVLCMAFEGFVGIPAFLAALLWCLVVGFKRPPTPKS
jgi:hypothetical protein